MRHPLTELRNSLTSRARYAPVAAFVDDALHVAGGFGANNQTTDTSEIYDPHTVELHYHRKD